MTAAIDTLHGWTADPSYVGTTTVYGAVVIFSGGTSSYDLRGTFDGAAYSLFEVRQRTLVSGTPVTGWTSYVTIGSALSNTVFKTFASVGSPQSIEVEIRLTSETVGSYMFTLSVHASGSATVQDSIDFSLVIDEAVVELLPPIASFTVAPAVGRPPLTVEVDGSGSSDPDGSIVSYSWDWGDGSTDSTGVTASHEYEDEGTYTITLTVTDGDDLNDTETEDVVVAWSTVTNVIAGQPILLRVR